MSTDRNDLLRRAEKLLRQGRLEPAIAEYTRLVDEHPRDLATANLLGDLLLRAGQVDLAVARFAKTADRLAADGFVPKAAALYKKIIKIRPDDDAALLRMAELAIQQGLSAEARVCYQALYHGRLRRDDRQGAADAALLRVKLDPGDVGGRVDAARILAELGNRAAAASQLSEAGATLVEQGRRADGVKAFAEALRLNADDEVVRDRLVDLHLETGAIEAAADVARSASQLRRLAEALVAAGRSDTAVACLARGADERPDDRGIRVVLARVELGCGHTDAAFAALPPVADDEPADIALLRAEIMARAGRHDEARHIIGRVVATDARATEAAADLCLALAGTDPALALTCLEPVIDVIRERGDLTMARRVVQQLVDRSASPIEALRLMIDVCDDLADDDAVYHGQVRLTDELLAAGQFAEARVLAEILREKRPDVAGHAERLRAALEGMGLSSESALAGDEALDVSVEEDLEALLLPRLATGHSASPGPSEAGIDFVLDDGAADAPVSVDRVFDGGAMPERAAFEPDDLRLESLDPEHSAAGGDVELMPAAEEPPAVMEVDLSLALDELLHDHRIERLSMVAPHPAAGAEPEPVTFEPLSSEGGSAPVAGPNEGPAASDLDGFFERLRDEAGVEEQAEGAARAFDMASLAYEDGRIDDARQFLQLAARDARFRFRATALLAGIEREAGRLRDAIEWFERAAEAPAPTAGAWDALLYDLGSTLQQAGESRRALAVFMELESASPGYRDAAARIEALGASSALGGSAAPDGDLR